jgi:hypothetical protein
VSIGCEERQGCYEVDLAIEGQDNPIVYVDFQVFRHRDWEPYGSTVAARDTVEVYETSYWINDEEVTLEELEARLGRDVAQRAIEKATEI